MRKKKTLIIMTNSFRIINHLTQNNNKKMKIKMKVKMESKKMKVKVKKSQKMNNQRNKISMNSKRLRI